MSVPVFLFIVGIFCHGAFAAETTYSISFSKYLRPGTPLQLVTEILRASNPVEVVATLVADDSAISFSETMTIAEGNDGTLVFPSIGYDYAGSTDFNLTVTGFDSVTKKEVFKNSTKGLEYKKKALSIFIQTDKAIYQPSQTIKFRAVVVTPDLLPYEGIVTYKLQDPASNIILLEKDVKLLSGVAGSEFKLGKHSTLGTWKLSYSVFNYEEKLDIAVEEYKLPKFKVEISPDKTFLHPESTELSGQFTAKYTFGTNVKGSAEMEIKTEQRYYWYRNPEPQKKINKKFANFDGTQSFTIPVSELTSALGWNPQDYDRKLEITATVTDKTSQDKFNSTTTIDLRTKRIKVEAVAKPEHIKPGLPYTAYLKVTEFDGNVLSKTERDSLGMKIEATYNYAYNTTTWQRPPSKTESFDLDVQSDGSSILSIVAHPPTDKFESVSFSVQLSSYPDDYWNSWSASRFDSPSDTFLQVTTSSTSLSVGETAQIEIRTTEKSDAYSLTVLARGKLVRREMISPATYENEEESFKFDYTLTIEAEMSPSVYVVVSFTNDVGEVIADSVKINVQASLQNKVTIKTSSQKLDAGQPVTITVNAAAGSYIGLRAIDQSVLLLKEGNDITQEKIFKDLDKYGTSQDLSVWGGGWGRWWWPIPLGGADVSSVFENSGIIVLTDAYIPKKFQRYYPIVVDDMVPVMAFAEAADSNIRFKGQKVSSSSPGVKTRKNFPETWIWTNNYIGEDGSTTLTYNTPDTITTWELSSFAVSKTAGLGAVDKNSKITVIRSFFISLNLPPTMVRGEILNMRTTAFNYFNTPLSVTLTLDDNEWYDLVIVGNDSVAAGPVRNVVIPAEDSITVVFPIRFTKAGTARIQVTGISELAGDGVIRNLVVKPEGIPKNSPQSTIIDRSNTFEAPTVTAFTVNIPDDVVEGSTHVKFTVSGNIMGNALNNLGSLLKLPTGCGEQTMLSFAPDVYITTYLKKVGRLSGEIAQKSNSHIREGYQNELNYQHDDGSFSAFGNSDKSGSTWLTAFVVKCFIAAKQLNPVLVEERKINRAISFLISNQDKEGSFSEPGRVIHKDMQGGVASEETLAAYVLIALTEGKSFRKTDEVLGVVNKAKKFLESRVDKVDDTYSLAILAYALTLAESVKAGEVLATVDSRAIVSDGLRNWKKEGVTGISTCEKDDDTTCPFSNKKASASDIEITSYVLLSYAQMGWVDRAMPIVRWLVEQRGSFGGYSSTQDTVMGIQALAAIAAFFADRPMDLTLNVAHSGDESFILSSFIINKENSIVLQTADLPALPGVVTVTTTGVGFADIQVNTRYNLPVGPRKNEPFVVTVDVKDMDMGDILVLDICSEINKDNKEVIDGTGMYVVTIQLPSGYTTDPKKAMSMNKHVKLIELEGEEVAAYLDELPADKRICMKIKLIRFIQVVGVKPQLVKTYDYYQPGRMAFREYQSKSVEAFGVCELCGLDCVGCTGPMYGDWEPWTEEEGYCGKVVRRRKCLMGACNPDNMIEKKHGLPFPCPDFYHSLYNNSLTIDTCWAPNNIGDTSAYFGLPGSHLGGMKQYIRCESPTIGRGVIVGNGFTIALLVNPQILEKKMRQTILSIGPEYVPSKYVYFEKRPRSDIFWLKARLSKYEYTVKLSAGDIPLNVWTHLTIKITENRANVFVNGEIVGKSSKRRLKLTLPNWLTIRLGRAHTEKSSNRGDFKGSLSSLDFWSEPLADVDIKKHYEYYRDLMMPNKFLSSKRQLQYILPEKQWRCIGMIDLPKPKAVSNYCLAPVNQILAWYQVPFPYLS